MLIISSCVGIASAGSYIPASTACAENPISIPCERFGWDIGVEASYVEPRNNDQWFAQTTVDSYTAHRFFENDYDWAWGVEASLHFGTGNDLTAKWFGFDSVESTNIFADSIRFVGETTGRRAFATVKNNFDSAFLEFGQRYDVGNDVDIRTSFGIQFARIENQFDSAESQLDPIDLLRTLNLASTFRGVGPQVGFASAYRLVGDLRLVGRATGALLVGNLKSDILVANSDPNDPEVTDGLISTERTLVSSLNSRLGLGYTVSLWGDTSLIAELGWQIDNYYNSIRHRISSSSTGIMQATSDFTMQGPYFNLKFYA